MKTHEVFLNESVPEAITGIHIQDQNPNGPASSINAGILVDNQTPGANVYAIKTGLGPVDFGDTVNAVGGFKANGTAGITETCTVIPTGITITKGIITAITGGTCTP